MSTSLRMTAVYLAEVQFALLDFVVQSSPAVKRSDLIRLAVEKFVLSHANWDKGRFETFALAYAKKLKGDARASFLQDVARVTRERNVVEGASLPSAISMEFASDAGDFDL